jgi:hypothetical protein
VALELSQPWSHVKRAQERGVLRQSIPVGILVIAPSIDCVRVFLGDANGRIIHRTWQGFSMTLLRGQVVICAMNRDMRQKLARRRWGPYWSQSVCHPAASPASIPETLSNRFRRAEEARRWACQAGSEPSDRARSLSRKGQAFGEISAAGFDAMIGRLTKARFQRVICPVLYRISPSVHMDAVSRLT